MENYSEKKPTETRAITIRMPVDMYEALANTARREERSVTQQVLFILRAEYDRAGKVQT